MPVGSVKAEAEAKATMLAFKLVWLRALSIFANESTALLQESCIPVDPGRRGLRFALTR